MYDPEIESAFTRRACPGRHAGPSGRKLPSFDDQVPPEMPWSPGVRLANFAHISSCQFCYCFLHGFSKFCSLYKPRDDALHGK